MAENRDKYSDVGERLARLRVALGHPTDASFAAYLDISPQKLSNYLRGASRPDLMTAMSIVKRTRVTLDWIYYGEEGGLSLQLVDLLAEPTLAGKSVRR